MPSESPHFKKYIRRIVPISSKGQQLVRPMRSLDLGDIAWNIMRTSLAVLTDGGALATMIPYIPAVAGLLLLLLSMQGEVKLCKTQWRVAMQRLFDLAIIVVEIGEICRAHNLKEEDLPAHFHLIFQSVHTELRGVVEAFKECAETSGIMKHLLRPGMLRRIRQYESKLLHALQASQVNSMSDCPICSTHLLKGDSRAGCSLCAECSGAHEYKCRSSRERPFPV
ncbi:hypothetical protein BC826DRAFT_1025131 [Russula brevipes]|nr:hypothetical protein BC826DRAFT_1025131 [Russula brevipes]